MCPRDGKVSDFCCLFDRVCARACVYGLNRLKPRFIFKKRAPRAVNFFFFLLYFALNPHGGHSTTTTVYSQTLNSVNDDDGLN